MKGGGGKLKEERMRGAKFDLARRAREGDIDRQGERAREGEGQRRISQGVQSMYCLLCNTTPLIYSAE